MAETNVLEKSEFLAVDRPVSRISWAGIFLGAITTVAVGILLHALGAAIGLTAINPARGEWGGSAGLWTGIWSFLSIVIATFIGAMVGCRSSTLFFRRDAASQGLGIWALSFLAMLLFVTSMAATTTTNLATGALEGAGSAAQSQLQGGANAPRQLGRQLQQAMPGQQQGQQAAQTAKEVGAATGWWFFITALCGMLAGIFGGLAGLPKQLRTGKPMEVRRGAMRPRETTA